MIWPVLAVAGMCNISALPMTRTLLIGGARAPVQKKSAETLWGMGAGVLRDACADAGLAGVEAVYVANMLADELQGVKHLGPLIAEAAGLPGVESYSVHAAMATGAAALRTAYMAVESGAVRSAAALGVEIMQGEQTTAVLAKALHPTERERGETMITQVASLMQLYLDRYGLRHDVFAPFSLNARANAAKNPQALFQKSVSLEEIRASRVVHAPMQLFDCAPVCDGAACVIFARDDYAPASARPRVRLLASSAAVDRPAVADRADPLRLEAARISAARAFAQAGLAPQDVGFFEVHDAFTIMACLALEACGFAAAGEGWRLAAEGAIFPGGALPLSTFGGLIGRGHPIGATAVYQAAEILLQLQGRAGDLQVRSPRVALMQSVGGAGTTLFTHLFRAD